MLIHAGNYDLNYQHPTGAPTLIPAVALEQSLDFRCWRTGSHQDDSRQPPRCAIHIHGFHLQELKAILDDMQGKIDSFDMYITTDSDAKRQAIEAILTDHPVGMAAGCWRVLPSAGPGRNIAALFIDAYEHLNNYECALHLHSKRSIHTDISEQWRQSLMQNLVGSRQLITDIRSHFVHNDQLGVLIPQTCEPMRQYVNWGANFNLAQAIWKRVAPDQPLRADAPLVFPVGMMFWFRPRALRQLRDLLMTLQPLPAEPLPLDGSSLHAVERLVVHSCEVAGFEWRMICGDHAPSHQSLSPLPDQLSVLVGQPQTYANACTLLAQRTREVEAELAAPGKKPTRLKRLIKHISSPTWSLRALLKRIRRRRWN